jgi:hypothetical protein
MENSAHMREAFTMSITDKDLNEIEQRHRLATSGPWESFIEGRDHLSGDSFIRTGGEDIHLSGATQADQDFIAAAYRDIPALIAEIRVLRS